MVLAASNPSDSSTFSKTLQNPRLGQLVGYSVGRSGKKIMSSVSQVDCRPQSSDNQIGANHYTNAGGRISLILPSRPCY
jgi:hypothetical protein